MRIYTSNTHRGGHTDSAISPGFALPYLCSQRYAELCIDHILRIH
ncbi:MAG: hypothetical protein OFPII_17330 [Osedax symbiont Rs1]|nr:MAG: hypothetical protein OFPII_17330 [Osedax symbiont Rs1]